MRNKWEKFRGSEKLKQRTYKGIPDNVRGLFWGLLLDLQTIKSTQRGKYDVRKYILSNNFECNVRLLI